MEDHPSPETIANQAKKKNISLTSSLRLRSGVQKNPRRQLEDRPPPETISNQTKKP
jgi:hypothetical protein